MSERKVYTKEEVVATMPQQDPFLFIEEVEVCGDTAKGSYTIRGDENFLKGHFPGNPVFPASIMLEGLGQLAIFLLLKRTPDEGDIAPNPKCIFFTSADGVRCTRFCKPGDKLDFYITAKRVKFPLGLFEGRILVGEEKAAYAEKISLIFDKIV